MSDLHSNTGFRLPYWITISIKNNFLILDLHFDIGLSFGYRTSMPVSALYSDIGLLFRYRTSVLLLDIFPDFRLVLRSWTSAQMFNLFYVFHFPDIKLLFA